MLLLAGLPAAVGLRPQRPPPGGAPGARGGRPARPPPVDRAVVRAQRTDRRRRRSASTATATAAGSRYAARPAAADVEQDGPRPLGEAGVRAGRRRPARSSPTRGVLPHLPQLDGTDSHLYFGWYHGDDARPRRGFAAAVPAHGAVRQRVRRPGRARRRADFIDAGALARPRLGRPRRAPRPAEVDVFDQRVPPDALRHVRRVAATPRSAYQASCCATTSRRCAG